MLRPTPTQISLCPSDVAATTQRLHERRERQTTRKVTIPIRIKVSLEKARLKTVERNEAIDYRFPQPPNGRRQQTYSEDDNTSDQYPSSSATRRQQSYSEDILVLDQPIPLDSREFWDSVVAQAGRTSLGQSDKPKPSAEDLLSINDSDNFNIPQTSEYVGLYGSDGTVCGPTGQQGEQVNQSRKISLNSFESQLDLIGTYHDRSGPGEDHTLSPSSTPSSLASPRPVRGPTGHDSFQARRSHNPQASVDGSGDLVSPGYSSHVSSRALDPRSPPFFAGSSSIHPPLVIRPPRSGLSSRSLDPTLPPFVSGHEPTTSARVQPRPARNRYSSGVYDGPSEPFVPDSESTSPPLAYTGPSHRGPTSRSTLPRSSLYISQAVASSSPDKRSANHNPTGASIEDEIPVLARPPRRQKGYKPRSATYSWEESETERELVNAYDLQNSRGEGSSTIATSGTMTPSPSAMGQQQDHQSITQQYTSQHPSTQYSSPSLPAPYTTTPRSASFQTSVHSSPAYEHSPFQPSSSSFEDLTSQLESSQNLSSLHHAIAQLTPPSASSPPLTNPTTRPSHYTPSPSPPPPHTPHRSIRIYDDSLPASIQPQTPAHLRARPFPNAAFTAPAGAGRRVEVRTPRRVVRMGSPTRGVRGRSEWSEDQENWGEGELMLMVGSGEGGVRMGEGGRLERTPPRERGGRWGPDE